MRLRDKVDKFGILLPIFSAVAAAVWVFYKFVPAGAMRDGLCGYIFTLIFSVAAAFFGGFMGAGVWGMIEELLQPRNRKKQCVKRRENLRNDFAHSVDQSVRQKQQNENRHGSTFNVHSSKTDEKANLADGEWKRALKEEEFLSCLFSLMAKIAKADGRVAKCEVEAALSAFELFGAASDCRKFCVNMFNQAVKDNHSIDWYAERFRKVVPDEESAVYVYELLWDVACADGILKSVEKKVLRGLCKNLGIDESWYGVYCRRWHGRVVDEEDQLKEGKQAESRRSASCKDYKSGVSPIEDAYALLGCLPSASNMEISSAYRSAAKRYHPDRLKANGVPEALRAKADEKMKQVNAAWDDIRRVRGI